MVNICESAIKIITSNKRKWLKRLNQKVGRQDYGLQNIIAWSSVFWSGIRHLNECTFSYGTWKPCIAPFFKGRQLVKDADRRAGWGSWKKRKLCLNSKDTARVPGTKVSLRPTGLLLQENLENCFYEEKQMTVMVKSLTGASSAWDTTPWRSVHRQVKQLQMRIAKAVW